MTIPLSSTEISQMTDLGILFSCRCLACNNRVSDVLLSRHHSVTGHPARGFVTWLQSNHSHAPSLDYKATNELPFFADESKQQSNSAEQQTTRRIRHGKSNEDIPPASFGRIFTTLWSHRTTFNFTQNVQKTWSENEVQFWHDQEKRYCTTVCP